MDLVIEAPDGRLAAYCVCTIDHANNQRTGRKVGATDPIATHPDFQRRGLAFALLLAGMALHKERGMNAAEMSITSANLPMLAAASKAGFRIVSRKYWFSRTGK
jgi:GNAT superfamily N-acetyltransferase